MAHNTAAVRSVVNLWQPTGRSVVLGSSYVPWFMGEGEAGRLLVHSRSQCDRRFERVPVGVT